VGSWHLSLTLQPFWYDKLTPEEAGKDKREPRGISTPILTGPLGGFSGFFIAMIPAFLS